MSWAAWVPPRDSQTKNGMECVLVDVGNVELRGDEIPLNMRSERKESPVSMYTPDVQDVDDVLLISFLTNVSE